MKFFHNSESNDDPVDTPDRSFIELDKKVPLRAIQKPRIRVSRTGTPDSLRSSSRSSSRSTSALKISDSPSHQNCSPRSSSATGKSSSMERGRASVKKRQTYKAVAKGETVTSLTRIKDKKKWFSTCFFPYPGNSSITI